MKLPDYFLADLPDEATVTPQILTEACQTLRHNRADYLLPRSTQSLVESLAALAQEWLNPSYPFRALALEAGPKATGFSPATLASGLDTFYRQITYENLFDLLDQDLGHKNRLDDWFTSNPESRLHRASMARGPELIVHICASNVPSPTLASMVFGLMARSAQFIKCSQKTSLFPRLLAHSLHEVEPKLGACIEIAEWPGGDGTLEAVVFHEADCITATGSDETLQAIRGRLPGQARFLGYGHRVSFAYVAADQLTSLSAGRVAAAAAADIAAWNQLGCLSPHVLYVEHGGRITPEEFAQRLAEELASLEALEPRGEVSTEVAASIASRRAFYELRAAHSSETRCWFSKDSTAWSVIYEADPLFQYSCLHRFVYVKGVRDVSEALHAADPVQGRVSTVGIAAEPRRARKVAMELARWGVPRVCPIGQMQKPPLAWRHDGRPALGDLITWTDWEQ